MLSLGAIGFAAPWILTALLALPVIWWLLRVTPPLPSRQPFPPLRILLSLANQERAPKSSPWWLYLLRSLLALLIIVALSKPILNPSEQFEGSEPILLVVDDGWAAAVNWRGRALMMNNMLQQAARDGRQIALLTTAPPTAPASEQLQLKTPEAMKSLIGALKPLAWAGDRAAAAGRLSRASLPAPMQVVWLSDGLAAAGTEELVAALKRHGPITLVREAGPALAKILKPAEAGAVDRIRMTVERAPGQGAEQVWVRLAAENGQILARAAADFEAGERSLTIGLRAPTEVRNLAVRAEIEAGGSAGSIVLLDERWRRRPVGLLTASTAAQRSQPLLSQYLYINKALAPYAELSNGSLAELLAKPQAVLIMGDRGEISEDESDTIKTWVAGGGLLLRFAGPRLARNAGGLVPVKLRSGGRALGGALTWPRPVRLSRFGETSPFFGLKVPQDVLIRRQVLAQPSLELQRKTWARLNDGTPLVTAERQGEGWIVLVHTTANADWSNLALSGLFVDMLRRIVDLAHGVAAERADIELPPLISLNGAGMLEAPPASAIAMRSNERDIVPIGPRNPPGFYGRQDTRRALNLGSRVGALDAIGQPVGVGQFATYTNRAETDLTAWLIVAALVLVMIDMLATLWLRGALLRRPGIAALSMAVLICLSAVVSTPLPAAAQSAVEIGVSATEATRFAYVLTGNKSVDEMSRAGLTGLSAILQLRTAVEPKNPMAVNVERDELVFFPIIYWPVLASHPVLSAQAIERLKRYMQGGGLIVFDTRDARITNFDSSNALSTGAKARLRRLLRRLDVPPLMPVPRQHVLTRAFYLLQSFPGRYPNGTVWVEQKPGGLNDGVSSLIVGANDWAAAWAMDADGRPLAAMVPGGARQREFAYRFGVNLALYALTGNYKADQVHVPSILERLGQ